MIRIVAVQAGKQSDMNQQLGFGQTDSISFQTVNINRECITKLEGETKRTKPCERIC